LANPTVHFGRISELGSIISVPVWVSELQDQESSPAHRRLHRQRVSAHRAFHTVAVNPSIPSPNLELAVQTHEMQPSRTPNIAEGLSETFHRNVTEGNRFHRLLRSKVQRAFFGLQIGSQTSNIVAFLRFESASSISPVFPNGDSNIRAYAVFENDSSFAE
jgi:hypothetical protein